MSECHWPDDASEDLDENEYPDEDEFDDSSDDLFPCPECGGEVHEETQRCPHCGDYIVVNYSTSSIFGSRLWWWVALALLGVFAITVAVALDLI